jgi:hypothetical protein
MTTGTVAMMTGTVEMTMGDGRNNREDESK